MCSGGSDSSGYSVLGQRFDSQGAPLGDEFQVNTYTTDDQVLPAVTVDTDGDFVVVWSSDGSGGSDSDSWSVQGKRFDSAGAPLGEEFQGDGLEPVGGIRGGPAALELDSCSGSMHAQTIPDHRSGASPISCIVPSPLGVWVRAASRMPGSPGERLPGSG